MPDPSPRVVLLSLDAFLDRHLSPNLTPRLWSLAATGAHAPDAGRAVLPASTYPNHATLLTGRFPAGHGILSNHAADPRPGVLPGWAGHPRVVLPTLFDACRAAGLRTAAVFGDQNLHRILNAEVADHSWPPAGLLPPGTARDAHGYAANAAVRPHLLAACVNGTFSFLFGHINETDTVGHDFGPDHPASLASHTATDALVGEILDALAPAWSRTVVIVVSDHGMEPVLDPVPIDLLGVPGVAALVAATLSDGGAALVHLSPGTDPDVASVAIRAVPGVAVCHAVGPTVLLVAAHAGRFFLVDPIPPYIGIHGGPNTLRTLALVGGGHPAVAVIASAIRSRPPHLADWAPTIASLLGLDLIDVDGFDLAPSTA